MTPSCLPSRPYSFASAVKVSGVVLSSAAFLLASALLTTMPARAQRTTVSDERQAEVPRDARLRGRIRSSTHGADGWRVAALGDNGERVEVAADAEGRFDVEVDENEDTVWRIFAYKQVGDAYTCTLPTMPLRAGNRTTLVAAGDRVVRHAIEVGGREHWPAGALEAFVLVDFDGKRLAYPLPVGADDPQLLVPVLPPGAFSLVFAIRGSIALATLNLDSRTQRDRPLSYVLPTPQEETIHVRIDGRPAAGVRLYANRLGSMCDEFDELSCREVGTTDARGQLRLQIPSLRVFRQGFFFSAVPSFVERFEYRYRDGVYRIDAETSGKVLRFDLQGRAEQFASFDFHAKSRTRAARRPATHEDLRAGFHHPSSTGTLWGRYTKPFLTAEARHGAAPLAPEALLAMEEMPTEAAVIVGEASAREVEIEVLKEDGGYAEAARVVVHVDGLPSRSFFAGRRGRLRFVAHRGATFSVAADWDGGASDIKKVAIADDEVARIVKVQLTATPSAWLSGRLLDKQGAPIANAVLSLHCFKTTESRGRPPIVRRTRSGDDGHYRVQLPFPEDSWSLKVEVRNRKGQILRAQYRGELRDLADLVDPLDLDAEIQPSDLPAILRGR